MSWREHRHQLSIEDFCLPFGGKLSGDNRWIKLAELIPWDELEDDYVFCLGDFQETYQYSSARPRVRNTHGGDCQES